MSISQYVYNHNDNDDAVDYIECLNNFSIAVSEARTACDSNPCRNAATCIGSIYDGSKYTCYCTTGFTGINCDGRFI